MFGVPNTPGIWKDFKEISKYVLSENGKFGIKLSDKEPKEEPILSEREMEILKMMIEGLNYKEIADKIFLSPHTVRTHISNIYKKLHVSNKAQMMKMAMKKGWF
jgi:DNA-binding CsgD family transcriptional regulator